jgi:uncharacterized protein
MTSSSGTPSSGTAPFTVASFNQYLNEKKLMASRCTVCGDMYLPPRALCPRCHGDQLEWVETSGRGKLAAFTVIYVGPTPMNNAGYSRENPYVSGIVELDEGVKISAQILGVDGKHPETIRVGTLLTVDFIERGEGDKRQVYLAFSA